MPSEAEIILHRVLKYAQETHWIRRALAGVAVLALLSIGVVYLYGALPRSYSLSLSGGEVLGNRHFLAKVLQEEGAGNGVHLVLRPMPNAQAALEAVSQRHLDMALIPGGMTRLYPHVQQVATLAPETMHLVARPGIERVEDLKGKVINVGSARAVTLDVLSFMGLRENIDFAISSRSDSELVAMPAHLLPDALVVVSLLPSYLVEFLVRERGYHLLEVPFPKALAARESWITPTTIPASTYGISPAMPAKPMEAVGVDMILVANERANPAAVIKVLETLFSPGVQTRANISLIESEAEMEEPTGYPLSSAASDYLKRNDSVISKKTFDKAKDLFGAVMSFATSVLIVWKWFRPKPAEPPPEPTGDARVRELIKELSSIEDFGRLNEIRAELLALAAGMKMENPGLIQTALIILMDTRTSLPRETG